MFRNVFIFYTTIVVIQIIYNQLKFKINYLDFVIFLSGGAIIFKIIYDVFYTSKSITYEEMAYLDKVNEHKYSLITCRVIVAFLNLYIIGFLPLAYFISIYI